MIKFLSKTKLKRLISICCVFLVFACIASCFVGCSHDHQLKKISKNLTTYTVEAGFDETEMVVSGVETVVFINDTDQTLGEVRFHLYPNAYRQGVKNTPVSPLKADQAYPNGYDFGGIDIQYAKQEGSELPFSVGGEEENILILPLLDELPSGKSTTIEISFETELANVNHRLGYGEHTVNLNHWFPILCHYDGDKWLEDVYCSTGDPFVMDVANFRVALTVEGYDIACSGDAKSQTSVDLKTRYEFCADAVRDFSIIMCKDFEVKEKEIDGVQVKYYYFDTVDALPDEIIELSCRALKYFNDKFGKYPYQTLSVVQSDFNEGGMEYPRLAMVTYGLDKDFFKQAVVHEIAHQWWCCVVGNDQIRNAWMDEGLAEYSTHLFFLDNDFGIDAVEEMKSSKKRLHDFLEITKNYFKQIDTSLNRSIRQYRNQTEYAYLNYVKSMIMFDDLYQLSGKNKFFKALKNYYDDNKFTLATPQKLIDSFSFAFGSDMTKVFEEYILGQEKTIANQ